MQRVYFDSYSLNSIFYLFFIFKNFIWSYSILTRIKKYTYTHTHTNNNMHVLKLDFFIFQMHK